MNDVALKQPAGLKVLFFAELWERFGFYTVQALMVLYLTQKLLWTDKPAYELYSAFSALIYATPIIGGYLADRFLGYRKAIFIGTGLYILGYFAMTSHNPMIFNLALAALICGNGFFKANVSTLLGKLYEQHDPRRDSGFTWFYMGINLGSFLAPITCTYIALTFGWHYGFMTAGIGMLICLAICLFGFKSLGNVGLPPVKMSFFTHLVFYVLLAGGLYGIAVLLKHDRLVTDALIILGIIAFSVLLFSAIFENKLQRQKLIALIILVAFSTLFWALYFQMFSSVTLFVERNVNRELFHHVIPTGMFTSMSGFFIIALSPLFAMLWLKLNRYNSKFNPSTPMKFAFGLVFVGAAFLNLAFALKLTGSTAIIALGWIVSYYFIITLGELSLSPTGLSMVTALAPPRLTGLVMGLWFLSLSAGFAVGGKFADLTAVPKGQVIPSITGPIYYHNFLYFGLAGIVTGIVLILLTPYLRKLMTA